MTLGAPGTPGTAAASTLGAAATPGVAPVTSSVTSSIQTPGA
jgi:hypothetical protein